MIINHRLPLRRPSFRPQSENLEDRRLLATLPTGFVETTVASGITNASAMEVAPDGRVWVLEQGGSVQVFHTGSTVGATALTIPAAAIDSRGERGLLGISFDPRYDGAGPATDFVYLYYTSTDSGSHNRVSRFTVDNTNPDQPTLNSETVLVDLDPLSSATNHNGGAIHVGPDGLLYVGVGENGTPANAQSLNNRLGKILRYNLDGSIPSDNPTSFPGIAGTTTGANRAIWAVGLRNPYTFAFRTNDGQMRINDVGQNAFEEVNPGIAGANYGWPQTEGDFDPTAFPNFTRPVYAYAHGTGSTQGFAISGAAYYVASTTAPNPFPSSYAGDYFFADFVSGRIDVLDAATGSVSTFATGVSSPVDLRVVSQDGSLLYLARGSGTAAKVVPVVVPPPTPRAAVVADYDGDGRTDLSGYLPSLGVLAFRPSAGGADVLVPFGNAGVDQTLPISGDFDGDGRTDIAAYLPSRALFAYRPSSGGADVVQFFGFAGFGGSIPTPGDFFGTGRDQVAVYLPAVGSFAIRPSGGGADAIIPFGFAGNAQTLPAVGDYFGTGRDDIAAYLPSLGLFAIRPSAGGADVLVPFGLSGPGQTIPIPGDYDGDGRTDIAAYLPTLALFAYRPSSGGADVLIPFGSANDGSIPVPGDYSGSGKTEIAIYYAPTATFAYRPAGTSGGSDVLAPFGAAGFGATLPSAQSAGSLAASTDPIVVPLQANAATTQASKISRRSTLPRRPSVTALQAKSIRGQSGESSLPAW